MNFAEFLKTPFPTEHLWATPPVTFPKFTNQKKKNYLKQSVQRLNIKFSDQFRYVGYGFVTFDSQQVAEHVIKTCKSVEFGGVEITVGPAKIRRRPPMSKLFRQNYINQTTCNPQFITPSAPYSVSTDGLFTFYQQPLIIPTTYPPRYPYFDPLVQLDNETVITSLPQNTNAPTSPGKKSFTSLRSFSPSRTCFDLFRILNFSILVFSH